MSAPRKITAWGIGRKLSLLGGSPDFQHVYHHDDVVRELIAALQEIKSLPRGESGFCRPIADAALAKIAQEGQR